MFARLSILIIRSALISTPLRFFCSCVNYSNRQYKLFAWVIQLKNCLDKSGCSFVTDTISDMQGDFESRW